MKTTNENIKRNNAFFILSEIITGKGPIKITPPLLSLYSTSPSILLREEIKNRRKDKNNKIIPIKVKIPFP